MSTNEIINPMIGSVQQAEIPKEHHELPSMHYVVTDWIIKLGDTAWAKYFLLLEMGFQPERNKTTEATRIPAPLDQVMKHLGIGSKTTLYNKVIKPLWNYGLIDLQVYEGDKRKTQKPVNIIVYPYPCNEFSRKILPLEKVRDYDKDYNSKAKIYANMKPKKQVENVDIDTVQKMDGIEIKENEENSDYPTVQKMDGTDFPTVQKMDGIDLYRTESVRNKDLKDLKEEERKEKEEEEEERASANIIFDAKFLNLKDKALSVGYTEEESISLVNYVHEFGIIDNLTDEIILRAFTLVARDLDKDMDIYDLAKWTAGKLDRVSKNQKRKAAGRKLNVPKNKVSNLADKKKSRKGAAVRKEMIPHWMNKDKENGKSSYEGTDPKTLNLGDKKTDSNLAARIEEMKKKLGQA